LPSVTYVKCSFALVSRFTRWNGRPIFPSATHLSASRVDLSCSILTTIAAHQMVWGVTRSITKSCPFRIDDVTGRTELTRTERQSVYAAHDAFVRHLLLTRVSGTLNRRHLGMESPPFDQLHLADSGSLSMPVLPAMRIELPCASNRNSRMLFQKKSPVSQHSCIR
jgi:hypothetical protein